MLRFVALAVWRGPLVSFRIAGDTYDSLMARIVGTVAQVLLPPIGIWVGGLASGVLALGIGTTIGALEAWRRLMTR